MTIRTEYPGQILLQALEHEASRPGWCRDIFLRNDLFIAVRRNYLNVYHQGASVFLIEMTGGGLIARTHVKYLMRAKGFYASIRADGGFEKSPAGAFWNHYAGPETLGDMIKAARRLAEAEKSGLHPLIVANPDVIDVEVTLTRKAEVEAADQDLMPEPSIRRARTDRIDAAVLAKRQGQAWVVFYEAKHFSNAELRAKDGEPPVLKKIEAYRQAIGKFGAVLEQRYRNGCAALVRIDDLRQRVRAEAGLPTSGREPGVTAREAAMAGVRIDPEPRLVIFGFDQAQKTDAAWKAHLAKLKSALGDKVQTIGKPTKKAGVLRD